MFTFRVIDTRPSKRVHVLLRRVGDDEVVTNELKIVENSFKQRVKRAAIVEASYWKYFRDISITYRRRLDKKKKRKKRC